MSLNLNLNFNQTVPNITLTGGLSASSLQISNASVSVSTIGSVLVTNGLVAVGTSNTIGNISVNPANLLSVNGVLQTPRLVGDLYLGNASQSNFYLDRDTAGALVMGYNTLKESTQATPFQVYNNSTDRTVLLACKSAGVSSGSNSVYIGTGLSNIPAFIYYTPSTITQSSSASSLTGGSAIIDNRTGFSATTGQYTVPITGYYQVSLDLRSSDSTTEYIYKINGDTLGVPAGRDPTASSRRHLSASFLRYYTQGTILYPYPSATITVNYFSFSIYLVTLA